MRNNLSRNAGKILTIVGIILCMFVIYRVNVFYSRENPHNTLLDKPLITIPIIVDWMETYPGKYPLIVFYSISVTPKFTFISSQIFGTINPDQPVMENIRLSRDRRQEAFIPAGIFWMGSKPTDPKISERKLPLQVYLDNYWIDMETVNNLNYGACVNDGGCQYSLSVTHPAYSLYRDPEYANYPVTYVTWKDAERFCEWAGGKLPTEAQWEKAASGPSNLIYPWGNSPPKPNQANVGNIRDGLVAAGSLPEGRSIYGVLDLGGNVREWVYDWYGVIYYHEGVISNPQGPANGEKRVLKGAAWTDPIKYSRSSHRSNHDPKSAGAERGFRCAYTN